MCTACCCKAFNNVGQCDGAMQIIGLTLVALPEVTKARE
jgi:hypothetical protein